MANNIIDIRKNYREVEDLLSFHYKEVEGEEFYRYIFPNNQNEGEYSGDYSKPNAIYLYEDETAKYPVKHTDFMTDDKERNLQRVTDLEKGLHRKRLISYGGLLKEIHKELNLSDVEDGDLVHVDDKKESLEDAFSIVAMWNWKRKNYYIRG